MKNIANIAASLFLVGVFAAVPAAKAQNEQRDEAQTKRVYDAEHRDYHSWDDNENRYWDQYVNENHLKAHEYARATKRQQTDYWKWRHEHPDDNRR